MRLSHRSLFLAAIYIYLCATTRFTSKEIQRTFLWSRTKENKICMHKTLALNYNKLKISKGSSQLSTVLANFHNTLDFSPNIIVDVGANRGDWTEEVIKIFPQARFLCVEPNPDHQANLEALQRKYLSNVFFAQTLLGDKKKKSVPYYSNPRANTGNSIYRENTKHFYHNNTNVSVKHLSMVTLADLAFEREESLSCIDILKIDSQGAEMDILRGGQRILPFISVIILEMSLVEYNLHGAVFPEIYKFLDEHDFVLKDITELRRHKRGVLISLDALFVNKKSALIGNIDRQISQK